MNTNEKIDKYFELGHEILEEFNYVENWKVFPLNDCRHFYWMLTDRKVFFQDDRPGDTPQYEDDPQDWMYEFELYTYGSLSGTESSVYQTEDLTLILVDTNTDDNKFLSIFDNSKRVW